MAGVDAAGRYLTAYLIEKSLSLDNVFVFSVIFTSFAVPERYRYHVLFWGIIGAIVFRGIFVVAGTALLSAFSWLVFVFGAFLIFTGIRMFRGSGGDSDPQNNRALKAFRRFLPVTEDYHGDHFFVRTDGKRCATPLLATLLVIESTDVIFAIDSVPAVLSVTQTTFVAYSSIVFAVLGLRALYFALEGLVDRFTYLHYGLAAILVFPRGGVPAARFQRARSNPRLAARDRCRHNGLHRGFPVRHARERARQRRGREEARWRGLLKRITAPPERRRRHLGVNFKIHKVLS